MVSVEISVALTTHVYNLQTGNGYYFVGNSIANSGDMCNGRYVIAKNCRCTLLSWVRGYEGKTVTSSPKMGDMTFEEWQEAKPVSNPIDLPERKAERIRWSYIQEYKR